jgi:glycosyltransferase involved in cell wall biosynthesis
MRVLMLNNEFPPLGGGSSSVNAELLRQFAQSGGPSVDLVTAAAGSTTERVEFGGDVVVHRLPVGNVDVLHARKRELLTYARRALPYARDLHRRRPFDVCMAWSTVPAGMIAMRLRASVGLPFVVRIGGADIPGADPRYRLLYPILRPVIRRIWLRSAAVVTKCRPEADAVSAFEPRARVVVVPNGVDRVRFGAAPRRADDATLRVLSVGRLIAHKGHGDVIEALRRLRRDHGVDAELEIVGSGTDRASLEAQARDAGLAEHVRFAGAVDRGRVAERYAAADVFALASLSENMSVATLEALAAGLPLVVTRVAGTEELVEEGVNGWTVDLHDVDALTRRLVALARDPAARRAMGDASRARAERFDWAEIAASYADLFARAADSQRPGATR